VPQVQKVAEMNGGEQHSWRLQSVRLPVADPCRGTSEMNGGEQHSRQLQSVRLPVAEMIMTPPRPALLVAVGRGHAGVYPSVAPSASWASQRHAHPQSAA
jgi:hypothetical protein